MSAFLFAYRKNAIPQNDLYIALHQRELIIVIHNIKANYVLRVLEPFPPRYNAFKVLENLSEKCRKKALQQGRHLILLFPLPKIMLSKEETSEKSEILLKYCTSFCVILYLVKFRCDKFLCAIDLCTFRDFARV